MSEGQSILDQMTRGIMEKKGKAAATLTRVGVERPPTVTLPVRPQNADLFLIEAELAAIDQAIGRIRQVINVSPDIETEPQRMAAAEARRGLPAGRGIGVALTEDYNPITGMSVPGSMLLTPEEREQTTAPAADPDDTENEDPPLSQFEQDFAAKAAAAQAQTFKTPEMDDGWRCPKHGAFVEKISKKGRTYRACPEQCGEFER